MKTPIYSILLFIYSIVSCKAQTIIPMDNISHYEYTPNYYVKDVNNEFEKFEGTWTYQNGTTELTFM